jgi:hypothetical protein
MMQAMLAENWTSRAAADADALSSSTAQVAAPPAFNPAAPEYNVGEPLVAAHNNRLQDTFM